MREVALVSSVCFALWLFTLTNCSQCFGQRTLLMLEKKNQNKNVDYKPGDIISFQINNKKSKIKGEIADLRDSLIVFKGFEIEVKEITCLYIDEKTKWWLRFKIAQ